MIVRTDGDALFKGSTLIDGPEGFLAGISRKPSCRNGGTGEHELRVRRGEELWEILPPDQGGAS